MKGNNVALGWYVFAAVVGFASGASFSKTKYHKGKLDAYLECSKIARDISHDMKVLQASKEES